MNAAEKKGRDRKVPTRKVCPRCGVEKNRAKAFTHRSDGTVFSWCKECNKDYRRERAEKLRAEKGQNL